MAFSFLTNQTFAQWSTNPSINNAITTATDDQFAIAVIPDGDGGAIITWADRRSGSTNDIYAQRISEEGTVLWNMNGVPICTAADNQYAPSIVTDDSGGAIITWYDRRSGTNNDIYAQHINSDGLVQWTADGVIVSAATDNQYNPTIATDGNHGAIITWEDRRTSGVYDIYAQRVNSAGTMLWTADGVPVCTATLEQNKPKIMTDGMGGAIIHWLDHRSGVDDDIYAQRINSAGLPQWTADGVAICTAVGTQASPNMVSDANGGAILTWQDFRIGSNPNIFAQRINAAGVVQWTVNGVSICAATGDQQLPVIAMDRSGDAIITWVDYRTPSNTDLFAQRINASGVAQWSTDGLAVVAAVQNQLSPTIIPDATGGSIITWRDYRNGTNYDVYAQRLSETGVAQWTTDGVAVASAVGHQNSPIIVSDDERGAIISWLDYRLGSFADIYAQHIGPNGNLCTNPIVDLGEDISQCSGSVLLDAGNAGSSFLWSNDSTSQTVTASSSDIYVVVVTDTTGCSASDTLSVKINEYPRVEYNEIDTIVCSIGAPVTLAQGLPIGGTYTGMGISGNIFDQTVTGIGNFNIVYSFTDSNGCASKDSSSIEVVICEGIFDGKTNPTVQVFPNPSTGIFTVVGSDTRDQTIAIYNEWGLKIGSFILTEGQTKIDLSTQKSGIYLMQIINETEANSGVQKIIITK